MHVTRQFKQVIQELQLVECGGWQNQTKHFGLLGFLITQDIDAFCYCQVLVKASQIGEFAVWRSTMIMLVDDC